MNLMWCCLYDNKVITRNWTRSYKWKITFGLLDYSDVLQREDPMNSDALYVRGLCLYYEDMVDKAFQHFQQVLRLAPDHSKAKEVYKVKFLLRWGNL